MPVLLPAPTVELVEAECRKFDSDASTKLGEEAIAQLREQFPRNTEVSHVLLKILVLNKVYSTRIDDMEVWPLARHIAGLGIDSLMDQGDAAAVIRIYKCANLRMYYSFATKFCSWHNPTAYPIYDRYTDVCLWAYRKQDRFADFQRQDLGRYEKLVEIVSTFRHRYGLHCFTFRQMDKFLWRTGARILGVIAPQADESRITGVTTGSLTEGN
jgi:hypothetical protein